MFESKTEGEVFIDKIIENTIQEWIKKGIIKKSCENLDIKKKHKLINKYILKGEKIVYNDEAIEYYIESYIKKGIFDKSCKDLDIEEKRRLLDEHNAEEYRKKQEQHRMWEEDEEIKKLIKEAQKGTDLEGSNSNWISGEKSFLFMQEIERIEYDRKIRQENEKKGISNNPAPEIIWKEFYKDKSPKERYFLLKEELDKLIAEANVRRQKKRESIEKEEQEINFRLKMMDREGVWYGPSAEDKERAIAERSAYHKAEKEFESKRAGIIAEMESIVQADMMKKKSIDNKLQ